MGMVKNMRYNLVDAYNRELEGWWYETPPVMLRTFDVVGPMFNYYCDAAMYTKYYEPGTEIEVDLRVDLDV